VRPLFGVLLRQWRRARDASQLELALRAPTTQRHVSFLESGRARPSRAMVLTLAEALDVPLRARNEMLLAAGYAPHYPERSLTAAELTQAHGMLARILAHHEPYPALVTDGGWSIVMHNAAAGRIIERCVPARARGTPGAPPNLLELMCDPDGMRRHITSWATTGPALLARVRREAAAQPGSPSERLLRELLARGAFPPLAEPDDAPLEATIPMELRIGDVRLRLVNTLTTFGTPQDVTLQELRIEMSFPADDETDDALRRWAG
jgi:transcriptional regulator with XRE-family HTH domain